MLTETELERLRADSRSKDERASELRAKAEAKAEEARGEGVDLSTDAKARREVLDVYREADELAQEAADLRDDYTAALEQSGSRERDEHQRAPQDRRASVGGRLTASEQFRHFHDIAGRDLGAAAQALGSVEVMSRDETLRVFARDVDGDALTQPDRWSGVTVEDPNRPVTLFDRIMVTGMNDAALEYVAELARTENVAEAPYGTEPEPTDDSNLLQESSYAFEERSVAAKRVGHFVPASEAQVRDIAQFRTLVDARLVSGVNRELETLAISGSSAGGDPFDGIINTSGVLTLDGTDLARGDAVHKALTQVRITAFEEPDLIGIHPVDFEEYVLEKNSNGDYLHGRAAVTPSLIWGKPYLLSTAFPQGTPVVGQYATSAMLGIRDGLAVSATDTHKDWFLRGWLAIRAQVRAAFGVIRPVTFCLVENFGAEAV